MSSPESTVVPGLQPGLKFHVSGGGENTEWLDFETKKSYTNAFIICGAKVFFNLLLFTSSTFSFPFIYRYCLGIRSEDSGKDC